MEASAAELGGFIHAPQSIDEEVHECLVCLTRQVVQPGGFSESCSDLCGDDLRAEQRVILFEACWILRTNSSRPASWGFNLKAKQEKRAQIHGYLPEELALMLSWYLESPPSDTTYRQSDQHQCQEILNNGIRAFEMWTWRVTKDRYKRSNISILNEINPIRSLEYQIFKQTLTHFGHIMRANGI
ncbi:hypothetical protein LAZ67_6003979 [Cordylochernes scorpioides]|uniref:Uncharacterized protein n=1 Tax=Cordylochernes scorpioides TaxID=51811 RepID=A0ABY6KMJ1_9ARAC|nr:hypothetical protein LAZ67_6003979 [Cordylochernes scorpioides]